MKYIALFNRTKQALITVVGLLFVSVSPVVFAEEDAALEVPSESIELETVVTEAPNENPYEPTFMTQEELEKYPFEVEEYDYTISELTVGQQTVLKQWRRTGRDLFARKLGILSIKGREKDLAALQQLINRRVIRDDEIESWQAIGVLFGDILANEFHMHWVSFEDDRGANKALQWKDSDNFMFPVTMFSKRVRFGEKIKVYELYAKLKKQYEVFKQEDLKPKLPNPIKKR